MIMIQVLSITMEEHSMKRKEPYMAYRKVTQISDIQDKSLILLKMNDYIVIMLTIKFNA